VVFAVELKYNIDVCAEAIRKLTGFTEHGMFTFTEGIFEKACFGSTSHLVYHLWQKELLAHRLL
jgi:hypothetical protein